MSILKKIVNLLGDIGNFEKDSNSDGVADGWGKGPQGTVSIVDVNFSQGLRAQRVASIAGDNNISSRRVEILNFQYEAGKMYLVSCDSVSNALALPALEVQFGTAWTSIDGLPGYTNNHLFVVVKPTTNGSDGIIRLRNRAVAGAISYVDFDAVRVYELTKEEADSLTGLHPFAVRERFPYTDTSFYLPDIRSFNTANPILGEKLYDRLPRIYRLFEEDQKPVPFPLKRFFQIAGVGMEFLKEKIDGHMNMYDPLTCPTELLPYLYRLSGFDPPNFLDEGRRRSFLKALPLLYQDKGSRKVFNYIGRTIFGADTELVATTREGSNIFIDLSVLVNGNINNVDVKAEQFRFLAEQFRPVNRKLNVVVELMYYDEMQVFRNDAGDVHEVSFAAESDDSKNRLNLLPAISGWGGSWGTRYAFPTNYSGKVQGSLIENPHIARSTFAAAARLPSEAGWTEFSPVGYANIQSVDGAIAVTSTTTNGQRAQHSFSIDLIAAIERKYGQPIPGATVDDKVTWMRNNIYQISYTWHGYSSGPAPSGSSASIGHFRASNNNYLTSGSDSTVVAEKSRDILMTAEPTAINPDGFLYLIAYAVQSNGTVASTINTDRVEVRLTLKSGGFVEPSLTTYPSDPYKTTLKAEVEDQSTQVSIPAKKNTTYTFSGYRTGKILVKELGTRSAVLAEHVKDLTNTPGDVKKTFTTGNSALDIQVTLTNTGAGDFTFQNIVLVEGNGEGLPGDDFSVPEVWTETESDSYDKSKRADDDSGNMEFTVADTDIYAPRKDTDDYLFDELIIGMRIGTGRLGTMRFG